MTIDEAKKGARVKLSTDFLTVPAGSKGRILGSGLGFVIIKWRYNPDKELRYTQIAYTNLDILKYLELLKSESREKGW